MKSYTKDEFVNYVKSLEFEELGDCAAFITQYYEYYVNTPQEPIEEKDLAFEKYLILLAKFGMQFVYFTSMVIDMREKINEELEREENGGEGSLAERVE